MRFLRPAAVLSGLLVMTATPAFADPILGSLTNWVVFALNNGSLEINSATTVIGNVGYSNNVAVPNAQKVDIFNGGVYVYGGASTDNLYAKADATFLPSDGIHTGNTSGVACTTPQSSGSLVFTCDGASVNTALDSRCFYGCQAASCAVLSLRAPPRSVVMARWTSMAA